jgi:hypothetical protein
MSYKTRQDSITKEHSGLAFPTELKRDGELPIRGMILVEGPLRAKGSGKEA